MPLSIFGGIECCLVNSIAILRTVDPRYFNFNQLSICHGPAPALSAAMMDHSQLTSKKKHIHINNNWNVLRWRTRWVIPKAQHPYNIFFLAEVNYHSSFLGIQCWVALLHFLPKHIASCFQSKLLNHTGQLLM